MNEQRSWAYTMTKETQARTVVRRQHRAGASLRTDDEVSQEGGRGEGISQQSVGKSSSSELLNGSWS